MEISSKKGFTTHARMIKEKKNAKNISEAAVAQSVESSTPERKVRILDSPSENCHVR